MGMDVSQIVVEKFLEVNKKDFDLYKLGPKILAVALEGATKDWACYIGTIDLSSDEWPKIVLGGTKMNKRIASAIFPNFAKKYKWRS